MGMPSDASVIIDNDVNVIIFSSSAIIQTLNLFEY